VGGSLISYWSWSPLLPPEAGGGARQDGAEDDPGFAHPPRLACRGTAMARDSEETIQRSRAPTPFLSQRS
jgi:hypothetical protein